MYAKPPPIKAASLLSDGGWATSRMYAAGMATKTPVSPAAAPVPVGLATKSGLTTAVLAFVAGAVHLVAGGPIEETVTLLGGGFAALMTVLIGRYWQAAKMPHSVEVIAKILDELLERRAGR
jgi:hypothetical protein